MDPEKLPLTMLGRRRVLKDNDLWGERLTALSSRWTPETPTIARRNRDTEKLPLSTQQRQLHGNLTLTCFVADEALVTISSTLDIICLAIFDDMLVACNACTSCPRAGLFHTKLLREHLSSSFSPLPELETYANI